MSFAKWFYGWQCTGTPLFEVLLRLIIDEVGYDLIEIFIKSNIQLGPQIRNRRNVSPIIPSI